LAYWHQYAEDGEAGHHSAEGTGYHSTRSLTGYHGAEGAGHRGVGGWLSRHWGAGDHRHHSAGGGGTIDAGGVKKTP